MEKMKLTSRLIITVLLVLFVPACTRDRPTPEPATAVPEVQLPAVSDGETNDADSAQSGQSGSDSLPDADQPTVDAPEINVPGFQTPVVQPDASSEQQSDSANAAPDAENGEQTDESGTRTIQYTVASGDTLNLIAARFGITVDVIRQINYLRSDSIQIGQVLRVPLLEGYTPLGLPTPTPVPHTHIVSAGETLFAIANRYGVDATEIIAANNIANQDGLQIGQSLIIPGYVAPPEPESVPGQAGPATTGGFQVVHIVQPGEGLYAIANLYGVSATDIAAANNIQNFELLRVGQRLFVPGVSLDVAPSLNQRVHIVQAGEGLLQIAVNYGVSAESISRANNLADSDLIYPGQQLLIPDQ